MRFPNGNVPTAALLLVVVVVYCNLAADAVVPEEQRGGAGEDEFTHAAVRKVSQSEYLSALKAFPQCEHLYYLYPKLHPLGLRHRDRGQQPLGHPLRLSISARVSTDVSKGSHIHSNTP